MLGLSLIAMLALGATMAQGASAALPEFGHCVKALERNGEYQGRNCLVPAEGHGTYNWVPGPGPKPKFTGVGSGVVALETVGKKKIECGGEAYDGEYTGAKTETVTVTLIGCLESSTKKSCQSNPTKEGEIEGTVEGTLGYIQSNTKVGIDLKPKSPSTELFTFVCGKLPETSFVSYNVEGSVIGLLTPINKPVEELKILFKETAGKQSVQKFEGLAKDTLTTKRVAGVESTTEETGLRSLIEVANEEPIEVKAK